MITMTLAISYFVHQSSEGIAIKQDVKGTETLKTGMGLLILKIVNKFLWTEKSLVSAQDLIQTCMKTKDGRTCMGYASGQCAANCEESCLPSAPETIAGCTIGTCYDSIEGTCVAGATKKLCEEGLGTWFDDPNGNVPACKKGCCLIGNDAKFSTERECSRASELLGIERNFKADIASEAGCLALREPKVEGACVLGKDSLTQKNLCKFVTKESCGLMKGEFREGILCSNSELETNCQRQARSGCVEGEDGIYWFDSCGNKENIYDANKAKSFNDGKVLGKSESCSLSSGNNPVAKKGTCGNCNYLAGSVCGNKTATQKLDDNLQNFVCKDLSCTDENGVRRAHGESWCDYQSSIGVDDAANRATDVPGSTHFRKICWRGEIITEPCQGFRKYICVQQDAISNGRTFSTAACKINTWQECLYYNQVDDGLKQCNENKDCFIKGVYVGSKFNFNICAPRYPPGFDLEENPEGAVVGCGIGTQSCTVVYVKTLAHGWTCKQNCNCESAQFTEQMNDLCMSLGDCGASVDVNGRMSTEGYSISGAPPLGSNYLNGISKYKNPVPDKYAVPGNLTSFALGIPGDVGAAGELKNPIDREFLKSSW